jgi:hypothetical protein
VPEGRDMRKRQTRIGKLLATASLLAAPLAALAASPTVASAQVGGKGFAFQPPHATITIHGGLTQPRASSDLFRFSMDELTLGRDDFRSGTVGVDIGITLNERMELVLGWAQSQSESPSEFREWVDNNDLPIEQTTRFRRVPVTASLRYHLAPRGRRVGSIAWIPTTLVPFVSVGGGMMSYRFEQVGDFIDYSTLDVFYDRYSSKGRTGMVQGSAGANWSLNPYILLTGELKYVHASARLSDDFRGFRPLDLSGVGTTIGLTFRF